MTWLSEAKTTAGWQSNYGRNPHMDLRAGWCGRDFRLLTVPEHPCRPAPGKLEVGRDRARGLTGGAGGAN